MPSPSSIPWLKVRGNSLYIQTVLPPKPNSTSPKPSRQLLKTGLKDTPEGRRQFLKLVRRLRVELDEGQFRWEEWGWVSPPPATTQQMVEQLRLKHLEEGGTLFAWRANVRVYEMVPEGPLTPERLVAPLSTWSVSQSRYRQAYWALTRLGKLAWGDEYGLDAPKPTYRDSHARRKEIPKDEEIEEVFDHLSPELQWMLGVIATYGLRPSELFNSEFRDGALWVSETSKTGERVVYPLRKEWVERWGLLEARWPREWPDLRTLRGRQQWLRQNSKTYRPEDARVIGNGRWTYLIQNRIRGGKLPWPLYNLRHAYALRCMRAGVPTTIAARLMGHSETLHISTYRKWLNQEMVRDFMERL